VTFKEITEDVLERSGYTLNAGTTRERIKRLVNQHYRQLLAFSRFSGYRDGHTPLVTVAAQPLYGIPVTLQRIDQIYDPNGNNAPLAKRSKAWLRADVRANQGPGTPIVYVDYGIKPIFRFPVETGSGIWAASSAAGDTTQTVTMQSFRVDGFTYNPSATTLTGTTRVQLGTLATLVDVEKLRLSAACAGDVTFYDAAVAGNILGVIPIGRTTQLFTVLQLYPVPSSAITYLVEGQRRVEDMDNDIDEPLIPLDFHQILVLRPLIAELREVKKQLTQASEIERSELIPLEAEMAAYPIVSADNIIVPEDGRSKARIQGSNLGSWFPTGRW